MREATRDVEAKTWRAEGLHGAEGMEEPGAELLGNARAVIHHLDHDGIAALRRRHRRVPLGGCRVDRVVDQLLTHLIELAAEAEDGGHVVLCLDLHPNRLRARLA